MILAKKNRLYDVITEPILLRIYRKRLSDIPSSVHFYQCHSL